MSGSSLLKGAETVQGLLEVAKDSIPQSHWKRTPVVLKATAGLRLLPEQKAQDLLYEVIFEVLCMSDDSFSLCEYFPYGVLVLCNVTAAFSIPPLLKHCGN